jgi:hypothetical protein
MVPRRSISQMIGCCFKVIDGQIQDVLTKMKKTPADLHVIVIEFADADSCNALAPVYREIINMMPAMLRKVKRRKDLLYAR